MELARKQRMNTDIRKKIFCVMMTSEDYLDAFEKLLRSVSNSMTGSTCYLPALAPPLLLTSFFRLFHFLLLSI